MRALSVAGGFSVRRVEVSAFGLLDALEHRDDGVVEQGSRRQERFGDPDPPWTSPVGGGSAATCPTTTAVPPAEAAWTRPNPPIPAGA
ncbi:hypothetical protein GCM10010199_63570 [Dactylosporangium roseum]